MSASPSQFEELSEALWKQGVAGFCPTTLSSPPKKLKERVTELGRWIHSGRFPGAKPLGIHLEGPFIHHLACGAHPPTALRKFDWHELDELWLASQGTLKILTLAPEILTSASLKRLIGWSQKRKILLSIGHSQATEEEAQHAFDLGFQGVTHAWNAMPFHHRRPGILGAALGREGVYLELMIDQVHVSPRLIDWTLQIHPQSSICFISDCLSAAGLSQKKALQQTWQPFGPLKIRVQDGACRLPDGHLAGGGLLLTHAYCQWIQLSASYKKLAIRKVLENTIHHITINPFRVLGIHSKGLIDRQVVWSVEDSNKVRVFPVDSYSGSR